MIEGSVAFKVCQCQRHRDPFRRPAQPTAVLNAFGLIVALLPFKVLQSSIIQVPVNVLKNEPFVFLRIPGACAVTKSRTLDLEPGPIFLCRVKGTTDALLE